MVPHNGGWARYLQSEEVSGLAPAPSVPTGLKLTAPGNSLGGTYFLLLSLRCPLDPQFWS